MIRILIMESHPELRARLQQVCAECHDLEVIEAVGTTAELLEQARARQPHAVVLRLAPPPQACFEALRALKEARPEIPAIVLSLYPADEYAFRALDAGASGYLMIEHARWQLPETLRMLVFSGPVMQDSFAAI